MFHFVDMPGLDRRNVIAVIDPESFLGLLEHFRHEVAVWTAAVEIVMARAYVVQARGHAAHRRRLALRNRVLGERRINTDVHMGIDAAREGERFLASKTSFACSAWMSGDRRATFPSLMAMSRQSTEVLLGRTTRAFLMTRS